LRFSNSFQTLPGTSPPSTLVEFACLGTVTNVGQGCQNASGVPDPVQIRVNGSALYALYVGCGTANDPTGGQCMTAIVPDGGVFKDQSVYGGFTLLCDAMGWNSTDTQNDEFLIDGGASTRAVAVVQTGPFIYGTDPAKARAGSYILCAP
jgi:hypothetical protein